MKLPAVGSLILVLVSLGLLLCQLAGSQGQGQSKPPSKDVYQGLRNLAFQSSRAKLGLSSPARPSEPWGVIMDWGLTGGTATVFALADGHASIYLSSGGGFIGGAQSHETVRLAAKRLVAAARECQPLAKATLAYPVPQHDEVFFYMLTDSGVFTAGARQEELTGHRHPLSKLADAGQDVITQYRLVVPPRE